MTLQSGFSDLAAEMVVGDRPSFSSISSSMSRALSRLGQNRFGIGFFGSVGFGFGSVGNGSASVRFNRFNRFSK